MSTHSSVKGTPEAIREWLTLLPPAFPANRSAWQETDSEPMTRATAGPQQSSASAWYDPGSRFWKTFQACLLQDTSEPFSETWPRAGLIVAGVFYRQPKWERRISGIGSGLLPTPVVPNGGRQHNLDNLTLDGNTLYRRNGSKAQMDLQTYVRMWPTPKAAGNRNSRAALIDEKGNGKKPSGLALEQAVEVSMGILPRELTTIDELPPKYRVMPTPNARDWRSGKGRQENGHSPQLPEVLGGQLNPTWVEWLMGWPLGWTDLKPLAMDKFQQWLEQHGCC